MIINMKCTRESQIQWQDVGFSPKFEVLLSHIAHILVINVFKIDGWQKYWGYDYILSNKLRQIVISYIKIKPIRKKIMVSFHISEYGNDDYISHIPHS